ncbi:ABC-type transport auxiliary lipoprotein family protein [Novosphingobium colocasiae]|uniref:ABC-type transport auxiliary lipoprotein component domain-containing protein n=1 Tax=Novosphingobium colocasiae TaxID=1256513 RepID=A0A918UHN5_9SPHN|nr:ABC-type transport auxiliary lipoprotein family protein [Novosphingobium colocasiae]GGZ10117.1 hypothetical protein GCM10011614_26270 [Novosphingobium colocasiae]
MRMLTGLAALALLSGCAMMGKADAPVTMRLAPAFAGDGAPVLAGSVTVSPVRAGGALAVQRYAYVDPARPAEINQAASLFWEEPPPRLIERALVSGLRGRYAVVTGPEAPVAADMRVIAILTHFEEVSAPGVAQARVGFEASVVAGGKVVRTGSYCANAPIAGSTATDRARGFEAAVEGAVGAFVQALAKGATSAPSC